MIARSLMSAPGNAGPSVEAGRIVLQIRSATPNSIALRAAVEVARAMQSELQSIFIEDENLAAAAGLSCAREFSFGSGRTVSFSRERVEQEFRAAAAHISRQIEHLTMTARVRTRFGVVRGQPEQGVLHDCSEAMFVALAEPLSPGDAEFMRTVLSQAQHLGGFLFVGPHARRLAGPIVVVAEEARRLPQLIAHARRLTSAQRRQIIVLIAGEKGVAGNTIEAEARELLGEDGQRPIVIIEDARGQAAVLAQAVRRLMGGLVIGHMGELLTPGENELRALAAALESPMLLLR